MVAPILKAWKKSAGGTNKNYNASIDKSGLNTSPYASSFVSSNTIDVDYQRATDSGEAYAVGKQFMAVGSNTIVYGYIDAGVVKVDSIVGDVVADTETLDPYIDVVGDAFIRDFYVDYVGVDRNDVDLYFISWIGGNAGQFLTVHLIRVASNGTITLRGDTGYGNDASSWESGWVWKRLNTATTYWYYMSIYDSTPNFTQLYYVIDLDAASVTGYGGSYQDPPTATHVYYYQPEKTTDPFYVMYYDGTNIKYTDDIGDNPIVWNTMTGGTGYVIAAVDEINGTVYATNSNKLYSGIITDDAPDTIAWTLVLNYGSGFTFVDADSDNDGGLLIVIKDDTYEYMMSFSQITEIGMTNAVISNAINYKSSCNIVCADNSNIYEIVGALTLFDRNSDEVFSGYPKPSSSPYKITLEGVDRELYNLMCNVAFAAKTLHFMVDDIIGDCDIMEIGNNGLDNVDTYTQNWGSSVAQHIALETLASMGAGYYRTFNKSCDFYKIADDQSSAKKIVFGTTSANLIEETANDIDQINKLVVFGAYSEDIDGVGTAGIIQITNEDEDDQAISGIKPLYIRRGDLETYDAVVAFSTNIWDQRKSSEDNIFVYKVRIMGTTFLKVGDQIAVENGNYVSDNMADTDYFIVKHEVDVTQGTSLLWLCTSISPSQKTYNNILPLTALTPSEGTDATEGDQSTKTSLTELVGGAGGGGGGYTDADVEAVIDAEIVGGQSIDNAIDALITTHTADDDAHHAKYTDAEVDAIVAAHAGDDDAHHALVTVTAPLTVVGQLVNLENDAAGVITQIDTGALSNLDTDIPTSKAVTTAIAAAGGGGGTDLEDVETLDDHAYSGITITATAGEILAIGDFVYFKSDSKLWKAKADAIATAQCVGCVGVAAAADAEATVLIYGFIRDDSFAAMTVGGTIYLSTGTAGAEQNTTVPSANGHCVSILGVAFASKILFVKPNSMIIEIIA